jgi:signal transduction histidine kinase
MITDLFNDDVYSKIFRDKGIKIEVNFEQTLIVNHNEQFFRDIFQNLITNSVKAIEDNVTEKLIKCTGRIEMINLLFIF